MFFRVFLLENGKLIDMLEKMFIVMSTDSLIIKKDIIARLGVL